jgi:two-component system, OmpR family, KDP operon response regulator KdpE
MTRILIVDDEPQLLRALVLNLRNRGFDVATATSGRDAIEQVVGLPPDVVVLDLGLPDRDGLAVIGELRSREPALPIVVLSARTGSHDKVAALDLGAIDYVTKPFDMNELIARLRAVQRRAGPGASDGTILVGPNTINLVARTARRADGSAVHLTPTEWRILDVLLHHPGRLISARDLLSAISRDPDHTEGSYLRIYLAQLRRKLEPVPSRPRYLLTEPGMGYRFQP